MDPTSESLEYLDEGANFFREGKYQEALHMFRLATLADLNFAIPKFAYAHALYALGMYEYAAYEIRLGMCLMPDWPEMGGDLTLMYGDPADFEEQLSALRAHIEIMISDQDALLVLGYVSFFSGDLNTAEESFKEFEFSTDRDTAYTAELFMNTIQTIKEELASQGK